MMATAGFGLVALCAVLSAIFVVRSADLVRAVLWLGVTLVATAVLYAMLGASFLAGVQLLLYVGGVMTLMVFGVMITRRHEGIATPTADTARPVRGALVAAAFFGVIAAAVLMTGGLDEPPGGTPAPRSLPDLGRAILHEHVLAFELLSLLLLAAIIGAVVIARRRDPGPAEDAAAPAAPVAAAPAADSVEEAAR